uniref:Dynactin subunit 6 n=1 Tax=Arion vulgaris TaxID=1028688 RepID=A0A0B6Y2S9_9EUPU
MAAPTKHNLSNPNLKIAAGATVCEDSELMGDITIGARTVIHPKARILAETGPIIIGEYNIIEELVTITNTSSTDENSGKVQIIGNNNMFEVGAIIESVRVGDNNIFESKAKVGSKVEIANGCIIGAGCVLNMAEQISDNTVIYGGNCERRIQREKPPLQALQIDFLTKIMPNYHYLIKPNIQPRTPTTIKK